MSSYCAFANDRYTAGRYLTSISKFLVSMSLLLILSMNVCNAGSRLGDKPYSSLEVHIGYENEAAAARLNFPAYIELMGQNWNVYNEQFRQLGLLSDLWDQSESGEIQLEDSRNIPLSGADSRVFNRQIRILRVSWNEVGELCGYKANGSPNSGCAFNKRMPKCTIVVPHQRQYANGDINEYHQLLGHEMWHCLVGSFH